MLKRLLTEDGELTKISRRFVWMLVVIYCLIIVRMCFGPQIMIEGYQLRMFSASEEL